MLRVVGYLLVGLVVGFGAATLTGSLDRNRDRPATDAVPLERRLSELETALALERTERERLEAELEEALVELRGPSDGGGPGGDAERGPVGPAEAGGLRAGTGDAPADAESRPGPPRFGPGFRGLDDETRVARFVDAGISPERAQWIIQRESELRMEALQARYDAVRDGVPPDQRGPGVDFEATLRTELGDTDYERYLEALGRPVRVGVGSVLAGSPAERAGFEPGDQVIRYAGERVFDMNDLNRLTFEGQSGQSVAVDVLRDGQEIQLYLPRGPLGITGAGRFGRRP